MDVTVPHSVVYETDGKVSIDRVIESLEAQRRLLGETVPILEALVPELKIDAISISVVEISNQSPLREAFLVALIVAFQNDLSKEVPAAIQEITGVSVPPSYHTIVTFVAVLVMYYGMDAAYRIISRRLGTSRASRQMEAVVAQVATQLNVSEDRIRTVLHERYTKGRLGNLMDAVVKLVSPSKGENNAPIVVGGHRVSREEVAEVPAVSTPLEEEPDRQDPIEDIEIELHAQDIDKTKQGWAGIPKGHAKARLRMDLYPPITPAELWGKGSVRGDIILVSRVKDGKATPYMFHLVRLR